MDLRQLLQEMESIVLAYSGGVDSTFLLKVAKDVLRDKILAVTKRSPIHPERESQWAKKVAQDLGVRHLFTNSDEMKLENFVSNRPDRCYFCKRELLSQLRKVAQKENLKYLTDGSNL